MPPLAKGPSAKEVKIKGMSKKLKPVVIGESFCFHTGYMTT